MLLQFQVSARQLYRIVKLLIALNIIMLFGTWAFSLDLRLGHFVNKLIYEFNLASENVVAAWYSSMILFLSSIMSFICFLIDQRCFVSGKKRVINFGWVIFSVLFALLSLDELGSIHENIGNTKLFEDLGEWFMGSETAGWTIFTFVIGIVSLFMFVFGIFRLSVVKWAFIFMILGLLCYLTNPFQENFEIASHAAAADPGTWKRPVIFTLLEEGSEILGSLFFLLAVITYAIHARRQPGAPVTKQPAINISFTKNEAGYLVSFVIAGLILGMLIIKYIFGDVVGGDQVGVPQNWFPAIIALLVALYGFYIYGVLKPEQKYQRKLYMITGIISLLMSVYFGCNMYTSPLISGGIAHVIILNIVFALAIIASLQLFVAVKNRAIQLGVVLFFVFMYLSFFSGPSYAATLALLAFCSLLYTLVLYALYLKTWNEEHSFSLQ